MPLSYEQNSDRCQYAYTIEYKLLILNDEKTGKEINLPIPESNMLDVSHFVCIFITNSHIKQ
jgi:hypothetical protein